MSDPQATVNLLRPQQAQELLTEKKDLERQLGDPFIRPKLQDVGAMRKRLHQLTGQLDKYLPRPVTDPIERDRLAKRAEELTEEVRGAMLSQEEMRKNPPGATDHEVRFQRTMKPKVIELKNALLRLQADDSDPSLWDRDVANLEKIRPIGPVGRYRNDAQITGKFAMSGVPEEKFTAIFPDSPTCDTALKQVVRRGMSEEARKALSERMRAKWAAKRAAETVTV